MLDISSGERICYAVISEPVICLHHLLEMINLSKDKK